MSAEERLLQYVQIDTQSDPKSGTHPSAEKEFNLAEVLVKQLKEIGLEDASVDEYCYIYAHLASNLDHPSKTVGFLAHMDTAPDFTGTNVKPRIIENFDGKDIHLNDEITTKMDDFPQMRSFKGKRLMVTDGNTLLGADDKAGISAIMDALEYYHNHPEEKHGAISVAFTPDEEIGEGPMFFDVKKFNADFAYTMDGDTVNEMSDETFNASSAVVTFRGFSIHPGSAKDKMINAASAAAKFHELLPQAMTPEHTSGREGFIHLISFNGTCEKAVLEYILRDHDASKLEEKKELLKAAAAYINQEYGAGTVTVEISDQYRNMKEVLEKHPQAADTALQAMRDLGLKAEDVVTRGGTDGAEISFMGLPCPNLGTGGGNFHGRYEYCVLDELEMAVKLIRRIVTLTAEGE